MAYISKEYNSCKHKCLQEFLIRFGLFKFNSLEIKGGKEARNEKAQQAAQNPRTDTAKEY